MFCGLSDSELPSGWSWGMVGGTLAFAHFGMRLFPKVEEWPHRCILRPSPSPVTSWLCHLGFCLWPTLVLPLRDPCSSGFPAMGAGNPLLHSANHSGHVFAAIPGCLRGGAEIPLTLVLPGLHHAGRAGLHAGAQRRGPWGLWPWWGAGPWGAGPPGGQCGAAACGPPPVPGSALG